MELKWLDGPEAADLLNPIIEARGWTALNGSASPCLTRARVALDDDGSVAGFFVLQLFPILGPVLVVEGAPSILFRQLVTDMRSFLSSAEARGWIVIAENPDVAKLCEQMGMKRIEYPVYCT